MGLRTNNNGYYAKAGFESHIRGFITRHQAKRSLQMVFLVLVTCAVLMPTRSEAMDIDPTVAVKFSYNFGEPVETAEWRLGVYMAEEGDTKLDGMGLVEMRMTAARGSHYALLDEEVKAGGLKAWGKQQISSIKSKLRFEDIREIVAELQQ